MCLQHQGSGWARDWWGPTLVLALWHGVTASPKMGSPRLYDSCGNPGMTFFLHYTLEGRIAGNIFKSLYSAQKWPKKLSFSCHFFLRWAEAHELFFFLWGCLQGFHTNPFLCFPKVLTSPKLTVSLLTQGDVLGKRSAWPDFVWTPPLNILSRLIFLNKTTNPIMVRCPALCPRGCYKKDIGQMVLVVKFPRPVKFCTKMCILQFCGHQRLS